MAQLLDLDHTLWAAWCGPSVFRWAAQQDMRSILRLILVRASLTRFFLLLVREAPIGAMRAFLWLALLSARAWPGLLSAHAAFLSDNDSAYGQRGPSSFGGVCGREVKIERPLKNRIEETSMAVITEIATGAIERILPHVRVSAWKEDRWKNPCSVWDSQKRTAIRMTLAIGEDGGPSTAHRGFLY